MSWISGAMSYLWSAPVAAPPAAVPVAAIAEHPPASTEPVAEVIILKVETPEEKLQKQQVALRERLNDKWQVPIGWVKALVGNPDQISSLFYPIAYGEGCADGLKKQAWVEDIATLRELLPVFRAHSFDLTCLNIHALFVLFEACEEKEEELRTEILRRMESEPYTTTRRWSPDLQIHNDLINENSYQVFFNKILVFRDLSEEKKQAILNRCGLNLLISPTFKSFMQEIDSPAVKIYFQKALETFLGTFKGKQVYLWFAMEKTRIAQFAAAVASSSDLSEKGKEAMVKAVHGEFFLEQLNIHQTVFALVRHVETKAAAAPTDERLQNLNIALQYYPSAEIYGQCGAHFTAWRLSKETLTALAEVLVSWPPFIEGVHWVALVQMWPQLKCVWIEVKKAILTQLALARSERRWNEIKSPHFTVEDYETLEQIIPEGHDDYWELRIAKEKLIKGEAS